MLCGPRGFRSRALPCLSHLSLANAPVAKRQLSVPTHVGHSASEEVKVEIKAGLKDRISLHIQQAPRPALSNPIIIHLPPGIIRNEKPQSIFSLALSANATVVHIDYRLSGAKPYPCPVHDVLAGYDWVKQNLLPKVSVQDGQPEEAPARPRLGVCGQLLGGSLATMLGLTECHVGRTGISALAVNNPTVDWTQLGPPPDNAAGARVAAVESGLDLLSAEMTKLSISSFRDDAIDIDAVLQLRSSLFPKAQLYYDPFASPLLLFRTPTYDLPSSYLNMFNTEEDLDPSDDPDPPHQRKRRFYRKYPPPGLRLEVPKMRIEYGEDNLLGSQGHELAHAVRRSIRLAEEDKWGVLGRKGLESGIETVERPGLGLWGEREFAEVGAWFGEVLRT